MIGPHREGGLLVFREFFCSPDFPVLKASGNIHKLQPQQKLTVRKISGTKQGFLKKKRNSILHFFNIKWYCFSLFLQIKAKWTFFDWNLFWEPEIVLWLCCCLWRGCHHLHGSTSKFFKFLLLWSGYIRQVFLFGLY